MLTGGSPVLIRVRPSGGRQDRRLGPCELRAGQVGGVRVVVFSGPCVGRMRTRKAPVRAHWV